MTKALPSGFPSARTRRQHLPKSQARLAFLLTALLSLLFLIAALVTVTPAFSAGKAFAAIPPAPQGPNIYVNDLANVIQPDHARTMDELAAALDRATGAQLVVVTVESLGDTPIEDYALQLFRTWGIGQRDKNNGVLLLVNKENMLAGRSGRVRIEVGYGLEGAIPDGRAGHILDEYVLPAWEQGQYSEGIYRGFLALAGAIAEEYNLDLSKEADLAILAPYAGEQSSPPWLDIFIFLLFPVIFGLAAWSTGKGTHRHYRGPRGPFWGWPGGGFGGFGGGGFGGGSSGGGGASR